MLFKEPLTEWFFVNQKWFFYGIAWIIFLFLRVYSVDFSQYIIT